MKLSKVDLIYLTESVLLRKMVAISISTSIWNQLIDGYIDKPWIPDFRASNSNKDIIHATFQN